MEGARLPQALAVDIAKLAPHRIRHGEGYAEEFLARVKRDGHLNMAQNVFGLKYPADEMPRRIWYIMGAARNAGLEWFDQESEEQ